MKYRPQEAMIWLRHSSVQVNYSSSSDFLQRFFPQHAHKRLPNFLPIYNWKTSRITEDSAMSNEPNDTPSLDTTISLSDKDRLECDKLRIEIGHLSKPWWKQGTVWTGSLGALGILVGAFLSWQTGWFDLKQLEIKNSNLLRQAETKLLLAQKESLTAETAKLDSAKIALNSDVEHLNQQKSAEQFNITVLTNRISQLQRQRDEDESLTKALNSQVSKLTKENQEAQTLIARLNKLQTERDTAEETILQLRSHLAAAHESARSILSDMGDLVGLMAARNDKLSEFLTKQTSTFIRIGRWRAAYEGDTTTFKLGQFSNDTNSIPKTNSISKSTP